MTRKTYRGTALDVTFDLDVCIHAGECVRRLPQVFDTQRKPWILPDGADADAVRQVVACCPSGALAIVEKVAATAAPAAPAAEGVRIETTEHGPIRVRGPVRILAPDGSLLRETERVTFCGCARSANHPFCDGTHKLPRE